MTTISDVGVQAGAGPSEREQLELMRLFMRHAPVAVAMFDRCMRYLAVSQRWMKDYGLVESVIGRSHYDVFPELPARWRDAHRRGLAGETVLEEQDRFERADGSTQWLRWEIRPWLSDANEIGGIVIFTEDITARKQEEEERERLRIELAGRSVWLHAEQRFRALLESAPDAMIVVNDQGRIVLANSQAASLYGYSSQEFLEQPLEILISERFRANHVAHRTGYFANPRVRSMGEGLELLGRRKDGSTFPAEVSLSPLQTDEGLLVSSTIRDVTERKKSAEAMARLAAIVESAYDAIISKDLEGVILSWNPAAERMFGYSADEIVGQNIRILFPACEQEEQRILEQIQRGERIEPYETVGRRKDGSLIEIWLTTSPLKDSHGMLLGAAKIARDLTERKDMERRLKEEAQTDALTGAVTRRYFRELAQRELARVRRHSEPLSVIALDVDQFKDINDSYGHAVGDCVLKALTQTCSEVLREEDVIGRLGGDEFILLLPDTDAERAAKVAERLRNAIAGAKVIAAADRPLHFTASFGVATSTIGDAGIDNLLLRADRALYSAKRAGRNTVRVDDGQK